MALWLQDMYIWLGFSSDAAKLLIRDQGINSPERLRVLTDKNVFDNCNVVRKPGSKNANGMIDRGQQASVIAQENLKLAVFLFHHRWGCIIDWKVMGVCEDTMHLLAWQKRLENKYKEPNMLQEGGYGRNNEVHLWISYITLWCCKNTSCTYDWGDTYHD